jgi:hypothetical protein
MVEIAVIPARASHIRPIAEHIGMWDRRECLAFGQMPRTAIRLGLLGSTHAWTATADGRPIAMWGCCPVSVMDGSGKPWLLGADESRRHARKFLVHGLDSIAVMLESYNRLSNHVAAGNSAAIRLLLRWGFTIEWDAVNVGGVPFLAFHRER